MNEKKKKKEENNLVAAARCYDTPLNKVYAFHFSLKTIPDHMLVATYTTIRIEFKFYEYNAYDMHDKFNF